MTLDFLIPILLVSNRMEGKMPKRLSVPYQIAISFFLTLLCFLSVILSIFGISFLEKVGLLSFLRQSLGAYYGWLIMALFLGISFLISIGVLNFLAKRIGLLWKNITVSMNLSMGITYLLFFFFPYVISKESVNTFPFFLFSFLFLFYSAVINTCLFLGAFIRDSGKKRKLSCSSVISFLLNCYTFLLPTLLLFSMCFGESLVAGEILQLYRFPMARLGLPLLCLMLSFFTFYLRYREEKE